MVLTLLHNTLNTVVVGGSRFQQEYRQQLLTQLQQVVSLTQSLVTPSMA